MHAGRVGSPIQNIFQKRISDDFRIAHYRRICWIGALIGKSRREGYDIMLIQVPASKCWPGKRSQISPIQSVYNPTITDWDIRCILLC